MLVGHVGLPAAQGRQKKIGMKNSKNVCHLNYFHYLEIKSMNDIISVNRLTPNQTPRYIRKVSEATLVHFFFVINRRCL